MKIAVASVGEDEKSEISQRAGRAPYYLIFEDGKLVEKAKNPFAMGGGGAGFSVAKMLADKGVNLVVGRNFGPNMTGSLEERGLKYTETRGNVGEAVSKVKEEGK